MITEEILEKRVADATPLPDFLTGLDFQFPEELILLRKSQTNAHLYMKLANSEHCGIVCFTSYSAAREFNTEGIVCVLVEKTLDQAHDLAKQKGQPINCLILLDDPKKPVVHHVL